jgi:hypothetical protein
MTDISRLHAVLLALLAPLAARSAGAQPQTVTNTMTMPDMGSEMNNVH